MTWVIREFRHAFQTVSDQGRRVKQKEYLSNGALAVVDQGEAHVGGYTDDLSMKVDRTGPLIVFGDHTRRVKYVDFDFAVGAEGVKLLKPADDLDPKYAFWFLQSVRLPGRGYGRHFALLRETPVPVPSPAEQRRIVEILEDHLSRLDAADAYLDANKNRLDAIAMASLSTVRRSLGSTPVRRISEVADTALGKMLDAARQTGTPTLYLRNINVRWGFFDLSGLQTTLLTEREVERFNVLPGDVFACEGGEPGRCAVWRGQQTGIAYQKALHRLRVRNRGEMTPDFLALMLTEAIRSGRHDHLYTGTTIKHLPQEKLRQIEIPVPDSVTQQRVVVEAQQLTESKARLAHAHEAASVRSAALRRSLLSAAFAGQLVHMASDSSVAEELMGA